MIEHNLYMYNVFYCATDHGANEHHFNYDCSCNLQSKQYPGYASRYFLFNWRVSNHGPVGILVFNCHVSCIW